MRLGPMGHDGPPPCHLGPPFSSLGPGAPLWLVSRAVSCRAHRRVSPPWPKVEERFEWGRRCTAQSRGGGVEEAGGQRRHATTAAPFVAQRRRAGGGRLADAMSRCRRNPTVDAREAKAKGRKRSHGGILRGAEVVGEGSGGAPRRMVRL
jgi:hypothetical protein